MERVVHTANAFTADRKNGNGAGIVLDAKDLDEAQMLAIARQVGFSETAFVGDSQQSDSKRALLHFGSGVAALRTRDHRHVVAFARPWAGSPTFTAISKTTESGLAVMPRRASH